MVFELDCRGSCLIFDSLSASIFAGASMDVWALEKRLALCPAGSRLRDTKGDFVSDVLGTCFGSCVRF